MVITTAVVAFGTLFYVGVAIFQYLLMKESARQASEQTDKFIAATQRMADTTRDALNEAKRSNEETAKRAERAIQVSRDFADAAEKSAAALLAHLTLPANSTLTRILRWKPHSNLLVIPLPHLEYCFGTPAELTRSR